MSDGERDRCDAAGPPGGGAEGDPSSAGTGADPAGADAPRAGAGDAIDTPPSARVTSPLRRAIVWGGILLVTGLLCWRANAPAEMRPGDDGDLGVFLLRLQGRLLVGIAHLLGDDAAAGQNLAALGGGSLLQRQHLVALRAALEGTESARAAVVELDARLVEHRRQNPDFAPRAAELRTQELLERLYVEGRDAESLSDDERDHLRTQLAWLGRLATSSEPEREALRAGAARATGVLCALLALLFLCALAGLAMLVFLPALLASGHLPLHFAPGHPRPHLLAETFLSWLVLFVGLQLAADLIASAAQVSSLPLAAAAFPVSLIALVRLRSAHASWREVRTWIGWTRGHGIAREIAAGLLGYIVTLPLMAIGIVITATLAAAAGGVVAPTPTEPFAPLAGPSHPAVLELATGSPGATITLFLLAAVMAPLVEETVFRGLLHRHLRELTRPLGRLASFAVSSLCGGLLFAAIHPQGWIAIPVLSAIALGLALLREWRDSLIAPMVLHGISNGLVFAAVLLILRP